jgi:hypothetical protein
MSSQRRVEMVEKMMSEESGMLSADRAEMLKKKRLEELMLEDDDSWLFASDVKKWADMEDVEDTSVQQRINSSQQVRINYPGSNSSSSGAIYGETVGAPSTPASAEVSSTPAILLPFKKIVPRPTRSNGKDEVEIDETKSTQVIVLPIRHDTDDSTTDENADGDSPDERVKSRRKVRQRVVQRGRSKRPPIFMVPAVMSARQRKEEKKAEKVLKEKIKQETALSTLGEIAPLSARAKSLLGDYDSKYLRKVINIVTLWIEWFRTKPGWCGLQLIDETVCEFLKSIREQFAPNTLWSKLSFLKKYLFCTEGFSEDGRSAYPKTTSFLKKNGDGYNPHSAREFTMVGERRIQRYWAQENPDNATLLRIVASMAAVFTANRSEEAHSILLKNVRIKNEWEVEITSRRVKSNKIVQDHLILSTGEYSAGTIFGAFTRLAHPVPDMDAPYFLQVHNLSKKFTGTGCAATFWTTVARDIAAWLGYPPAEVEDFSSHSFRSTSATAMAENNADESRIALHGNWKSTKVLRERYIRKTDLFRRGNAEFILGKENIVSERNILSEGKEEKKRKRETVIRFPAKRICIDFDAEDMCFVVSHTSD